MPDDPFEDLEEFGLRAGLVAPKSKPRVIVPGGSVSITDSAETLYRLIAPTRRLFVRDGNVTQLVERDGRNVLDSLNSSAARSKLEEFVQFVKPARDEEDKLIYVSTTISREQADAYLNASARFLLPPINGVINFPLIVERARELRIINSGYDDATGLLIARNVPLPEVSLERAVETIKELLRDFDFQTPGDRSRALASLLTPALKFGGLLRGQIPADVAEADQSGSGKTYRQQMIAALYGETLSVITKKEGTGVGSLEESFGTHLVEGCPFVQFDNIRGKFQLQSLESFFTSKDRFAARPAYSKSINVDPSKFMILINSNGYEATKDQANRSSIIRIRKRDNHAFKRWVVGGEDRGTMLDFVADCQPLLLSCVFRIIREWHERGKPRTAEMRHRFQDWCQILDYIVQHILGEAPLMDGHAEAQQRVSSPDHTFLRAVGVALEERGRLGEEVRASEIYDLCEQAQMFIPGLSAENRHDGEAAQKVIGKIMSRVFIEGDTTTVDAFRISRRETVESSASLNAYPRKLYRFARTPAPRPETRE